MRKLPTVRCGGLRKLSALQGHDQVRREGFLQAALREQEVRLGGVRQVRVCVCMCLCMYVCMCVYEVGVRQVRRRVKYALIPDSTRVRRMSELTRDGMTEPTVSRDQFLRGAKGYRGNYNFTLQLSTSRIGNHTRLIYALLL